MTTMLLWAAVQPPMVRDVPDDDEYLPANISEMSVLTDQPLDQKDRTVRHVALSCVSS
jgi:hypothetical protein